MDVFKGSNQSPCTTIFLQGQRKLDVNKKNFQRQERNLVALYKMWAYERAGVEQRNVLYLHGGALLTLN